MTSFDRIILGAGISGLLAARRAVERGESVLVLEREHLEGGVLKPIEIGGIVVDAGAEAFSVVAPSALNLFRELGLGDDIVEPQRADARIVFSEALRYRIPHGVMGIPASLDDPELTQIVSPEALEQARILDAEPVQLTPGMTVAELVSQRLGQEFVAKLADPLLAGVHGSSARVLDAQSTIGAVVDAMPATGSLCAAVAHVRAAQPRPGAAVSSVRGGMHRVPAELLNQLRNSGGTVVFGVNALSYERRDARWVVSADDQHWQASNLTIATGSDPLLNTNDLVSNRTADPLDSISVDVVLVLALVESAQLNEYPLGSGALVAEGTGFTAKATTHVNAKWQWVNEQLAPNMHIIRLSFGRSGVLPEGDLVQTALTDLKHLYGVSDVTVHETRVVRWAQALSKPSPRAAVRITRAKQITTETGIELCGPLVSGNGLLGIISDHYQRKAA